MNRPVCFSRRSRLTQSPTRASRLAVEQLEAREVPAGIHATLVAGVLTIAGSLGDDRIDVRQLNGKISIDQAGIAINGQLARDVPVGSVKAIKVYGKTGDDSVAMHDTTRPTFIHLGLGSDGVQAGKGPTVVYGGNGDSNDGVDQIVSQPGHPIVGIAGPEDSFTPSNTADAKISLRDTPQSFWTINQASIVAEGLFDLMLRTGSTSAFKQPNGVQHADGSDLIFQRDDASLHLAENDEAGTITFFNAAFGTSPQASDLTKTITVHEMAHTFGPGRTIPTDVPLDQLSGDVQRWLALSGWVPVGGAWQHTDPAAVFFPGGDDNPSQDFAHTWERAARGIVTDANPKLQEKLTFVSRFLTSYFRAGIVFTPQNGRTTTEGGGTSRFSIRLNTQPLDTVTIGLSSSDTSEGRLSRSSLTFTPGNWNVPQIVRVIGRDDPVDDGNIPYILGTTPAISTDPWYSDLDPADISLVNRDNDTASVIVQPLTALVTAESGGSARFSVQLASRPLDTVRVRMSSSDLSEGRVSPGQLTFTPTNWFVPRTVYVMGLDDFLDDGDVRYNILFKPAISNDPKYSGLRPAPLSFVNLDNDGPPQPLNATGLWVGPATLNDAMGDYSGTMTLRLQGNNLNAIFSGTITLDLYLVRSRNPDFTPPSRYGQTTLFGTLTTLRFSFSADAGSLFQGDGRLVGNTLVGTLFQLTDDFVQQEGTFSVTRRA